MMKIKTIFQLSLRPFSKISPNMKETDLFEAFQGQGIYYFINGDIYAGEWVNSKFHGKGLYLLASGERYEGEFENGKKNG